MVTLHGLDYDTDGDGLSDHEEGICEGRVSYQNPARVLSTPSHSEVQFTTGPGSHLEEVRAIGNPAPVPPPTLDVFPLGFFALKVQSVTPGAATTVTVDLPPINVNTWWKYGPTPDNPQPHWYSWNYNPLTGIGAEFINTDSDPEFERVLLHFIDGQRGDSDLTANGIILDPGGPGFRSGPHVERVTINNGQNQRSRFFTVRIHFSDIVTLDRQAFELYLGSKRFSVAGFFTSVVDGKTVATLQFPTKFLQKYSLPEGQYRLVTKASAVHSQLGLSLEADHTDRFFRLFGDVNGDGVVNDSDATVFNSSIGKRAGQAGYLWYLDYDGNGRIDAVDRRAFQRRLRN
jgi:hypothetical protein